MSAHSPGRACATAGPAPGPAARARRPSHPLREVLPPRPGAPPELYLRAHGPDGAPLDPAAPLPPGARLSLDTWANAFPLAWHRRHGGASGVALEVEAAGPWQVTLRDWTPARGPRALSQARVTGRAVLPVPPHAEGRVWAELTAETGGPPPRLRWTTSAPPKREVALTLGLVTLGAEPGLADTLRALARIAPDTPELRRVLLVHQGESPLPAEIAAALPSDLLHVIRQPNLGGAGGFARTLAEAMALDPAPTHHLLMDDDIRLDPRMIPRAIRLLEHARKEIALGGAMLDALAPARCGEAGARLDRHGVVRPFAKDDDLARPAGEDPAGPPRGLNLVSRASDPGFNGWWFLALPLPAARRAGLPAPLFLRGDDTDYARRLAAAGAPTVTAPGLWVWHEPFHAKAPTWQHHYDLRNRLIHSLTHPGEAEPLPALDLLERLLTPALSQDPATAAWRLAAVRDVLAGPEALFRESPARRHQAVLALARHLAPEPVAAPPPGLPRLEAARPRTPLAHAAGFARALARLALPHAPGPAAVIPDHAAHPGATPRAGHIRAGREDTWFRLHRPRRALALRQTLQALWLALRWRLARRRLAPAWTEGLERHRSAAAWARRFGGSP
ncbi:MAG: glycosyltransferase family 2 protein [Pseudomonadota bacterium]